MLSTQYRLRLQAIGDKIAKGEAVDLSDMIWAEKLSAANRSAATILRQARRIAANPDMVKGGMDDFLNRLDFGGIGHEGKGVSGFDNVDEIVDWFIQDKPEDWRQRD